MDAELAIKWLNIGKAKLDEILSFERTPRDKTRISYNASNKATVTPQN
jgi:hypothetical protein